jgi:hypothetical protein
MPASNLPTDPRAINFFGAKDEDVSEYQKSLDDSIKALQQRYEQPNWFNVAAGFLKPQLGGFAASLGSAGEALGQNLEKQRESQLPIAQMRSQLAMSKIAMGQNKQASDKFAEWKASGKPMDEATYSNIVALAPNSTLAAAAKAAYEGDRSTLDLKMKQTQNTIAQVQIRMGIIDSLRASGKLTEEDANNQKAALQAQLNALPSATMVGPSDTAVDKNAASPPPVAGGAVPAPDAAAAAAKVPDAAAAAEKAKLTVLPNGARVGPDGLALSQAGIPIISQFRTKEDQEKLRKDGGYQDEKGNWFTKAGRPIAEDSRHFTGDAIDLDPNAKLTDEQKKLLAAQGFKQGSGKEANHWSRTPTAAPAAALVAAAKPAAAASVTPSDFKYTQSFKLPHVQAVTAPEKAANEAELAKAASANKVREKEYQTLAELNDPRNLSVAQNALAEASSSLKNQPQLAIAVTDQLRRAGSAAAMIDKGVGVSWSPFGGASINIPVQEGLRASLGGAEKTFQDTLINNLATVAYYGLLARGITPESAGAEKFKIQLLQETGVNQTPLAISHQLEQNKHHLVYGQNLYKAYTNGLPQVQGFLAPYHEIYTQSPEIKFETDLHNRKLEAERKDFDRQLAILYGAEKAAAEAKKKAKKP